MSLAANASRETRDFLRDVLALPLPSHSEQVETTRNLAVRLERQKAGRKAAEVAREKRRAVASPSGCMVAKPKAAKPAKPKAPKLAINGHGGGRHGGPRRTTSLTHEQQQRIRELYAAGDYGTLRDLSAAVGCQNSEIVITWMAKVGLRQRNATSRPNPERVPDGCISTGDLLAKIGLPKNRVMHRINKAGIRAVGGKGNLYWYSVEALRAAGFLR
jgi:hypothetical protein